MQMFATTHKRTASDGTSFEITHYYNTLMQSRTMIEIVGEPDTHCEIEHGHVTPDEIIYRYEESPAFW